MITSMRIIIVVLITLASGTVGVAQNRPGNTVMPVDEATTNRDLLAVRTEAKDALRSNEYDRFMTHVSADLQMQGAPGITLDGVRSVLPSMASKILAALSDGGSFTTTRGSVKGERQFCAPYLYSAFPTRFNELQIGEPPYVIASKNVAVRREPSVASRLVARLSYQLVYVTGSEVGTDGVLWGYIETFDGVRGYVHPSLMKYPGDLHVCFGKRHGEWLITSIGEKYPED